ncbi:hypothetical protein EOW77_0033690 [Bradyrhizobium yuanmingense]|uniref:hypothetical protein n=1 Tax=Bradyrhizobium yuanmingense TaxID=108015 RepID=UPI000FE2D3D2|nr:hypothetical protein [Bradyrhizobium yuanmingense]TGN74447.1 hypothetical protein EOW77_0033690 [Bradyrhizobium yuanmingense]
MSKVRGNARYLSNTVFAFSPSAPSSRQKKPIGWPLRIFVVVFATFQLGRCVTGRQQLLAACAGRGLVALGRDQATGSVA